MRLQAKMASSGKSLEEAMKVGLVINPIAGMGGPVGLKGTDGADTVEEAVSRGALPKAGIRAMEALKTVKDAGLDIEFITCSGTMGEASFELVGLTARTVYDPDDETGPDDTKNASRKFLEEGVDLVIFVGGDGTARDVLSILNGSCPILGIPAGVKMHSAVFLNRPQDLSETLMSFAASRATKEAEVMDIDEESFREGIVSSHLFGIARVPDDGKHVQSGKQSYSSGTADEETAEIAQYIVDTMDPDTTYIIGPGGTTAHIAKAMLSEKTLLGVDVYRDGYVVCRDASQRDLEAVTDSKRNMSIIVSPIGSQGFIFGRGNQQISPEVIRRVGIENVTVICTPTKLRSTPNLRVDTGDPRLDDQLRCNLKVVVGYKRRKLVRIV